MKDNPEINAMYEANKNLSEKITKLESELKEYMLFKEMWEWDQKQMREMKKQLRAKRNVLRVIVKKDQNSYVLMLTKVIDSEEGMYIEGIL